MGKRFKTFDNAPMRRRTRDSQMAFFLNQLENFDPALHEPLVSVSWGRDIKLRPGITMANESTSFTRQAYGGVGSLKNSSGASGGNMPWISPNTTDLASVMVNGQKITVPLRVLARELSYSSIELDRSQLTQQPIDQQQLNAMNELYQMNTDQMVYIGSSDVGATGLLNSSDITADTVANGISGSPLWVNKTPDEILDDVNSLLHACWSSAAFAICPGELRLPPYQFSLIAERKVSSAGNVSILKFLKENSISLQINGRELNIQPVKWLTARGAGSTDRMLVYTNDLNRVRFPMVPVRRETAYYKGIKFFAPYTWAFGELEIVYPETLRYADGI